jgi:hypothetical protein
MEFTIDTFHISHSDLFGQDHFIKGDNKEGIEESAMEDGETHDTADEFEVVQVLGIDTRVRVDLQRIVVVRRVFKKTTQSKISLYMTLVFFLNLPIEWIKHFMR